MNQIICSTMKKSREEDADVSSPISRLPDEIILQILNKIIDLKSLCCCYLVSKRFSTIVLQVDSVSFTAPRIPDKNTVGDVAQSTPFPPQFCLYYGESFLFARKFLSMLRGVKSLCIQFPSSSFHMAIDDHFLFKWKVNFGSRVESFIFLSPNSVCDKEEFYLNGIGIGDDEDDFFKQKSSILFKCLKDVIAWHMMFLDIIKDLPMLQKVSITDSRRRGRLSLSGGKLVEVKEWVHSASETEFNRLEVPNIMSSCYIPVLKLPVSGYVMKGVYLFVMEMKDLQGGNDVLMNSDDGFEDKEEAAYTEAVKEILEKHKAMIHVSELVLR